MGIDLIGHGGACFRSYGWHACLDLALAFGWQPAGTVAWHEYTGPPSKWDGGYLTDDFQIVTDYDAKALAAALRRALSALRAKTRLTKQQTQAWESMNINMVRTLADYAGKGHFAIL